MGHGVFELIVEH